MSVGGNLGDSLAVTKNDYRVPHAGNFIQVVADEHHAHSTGLELVDHSEQGFAFGARESSCGFVQDEYPGVQRKSLRHFHQLLARDTQIPEPRLRIEIHTDAGHCILRDVSQLLTINQAQLPWFTPQGDVLGHRHGGDQVQLLMDGGDPQSLGRLDVRQVDDGTIHLYLARVRLVDTGHHLDEGRFPGAVLSQ